MVSLSTFYSHKGTMATVLPIITGRSPLSLRLIDWFVTNYAKRYNVTFVTRRGGPSETSFNVYLGYRAQLKAYSKQQFDPFRRRDRIVFFYERDKSVETTIGQLNFFRWVLQNDVLAYIEAHQKDVEVDMLRHNRPISTPDHPIEAESITRDEDDASTSSSSCGEEDDDRETIGVAPSEGCVPRRQRRRRRCRATEGSIVRSKQPSDAQVVLGSVRTAVGSGSGSTAILSHVEGIHVLRFD